MCPLSSNPRRYPKRQHRPSAVLYVRLPASKQPPRRQANPLLSRVMKWKGSEISLRWLEKYKVSLLNNYKPWWPQGGIKFILRPEYLRVDGIEDDA